MAKIRTYTGGNVGARNLMEVPAGPRATADAFGAARARDLYNLGQAVENVGGEVLRIAEIRAKRADDAMIRTLDTEAGDAWRAWEKEQTETRKGLDARDLADEAAKWWEARKKSDIERLDANRPRQREMIEALYGSKRDRGVAAFERYSFAEVTNAQIKSRELETEGFLREAKAEYLQNPAKLEELRLLRHANILYKNRGQAKEARDEELRLADKEFYTALADAHARRDPAEALAYLDDEKKKKAFPPGEWEKKRMEYTQAQVEAEQKAIVDQGIGRVTRTIQAGGNRSNIHLQLVDEVGKEVADKVMGGVDKWAGYVESEAEAAKKVEEARKKRASRGEAVLSESAGREGRRLGAMAEEEMTPSQYREYAYANFPEKYAEILIKAAEAERAAKMATNVVTKANRARELDAELKAAGYDARKMPSFASLSVDEQNAWLKKGRDYLSNTEEPASEGAVIRHYNRLNSLSDDDLLDLWNDPAEFDRIEEQLGGPSNPRFERLQSRIDKILADERDQGAKERAEKAETFKFLDSEIKTIERDARQMLRATGRALEKEEEEAFIDSVLQYADQRYQEEMNSAEVGKVEELPPEVRKRIHAEALISYRTPVSGVWPFRSGGETLTAAEAWAQRKDVSNLDVVAESLPPAERGNLAASGQVRELRKPEGTVHIQANISPADAPEKVRIAYRRYGGAVYRDLSSGWWLLVPESGDAFTFGPGGDADDVIPRKAIQAITGGTEDDYAEQMLEQMEAERRQLNERQLNEGLELNRKLNSGEL